MLSLFKFIVLLFWPPHNDLEAGPAAGPDADQPGEQRALLAGLQAELVTKNALLDLLGRNLRGAHPADGFVLVLIDGDGCIPTPKLLSAGKAGGAVAASALRDAVVKEAAKVGVEVKTILVYYVCNLAGLKKILQSTEGLQCATTEAFLAGFASASPLFAWIDAGQKNQAADDVIRAYIRLFAPFPQCSRVYLGVSHDGGYAADLVWLNARCLGHKVRLLRGYREVPQKITQAISKPPLALPNLFREKRISAPNPSQANVGNGVPSSPVPGAPTSTSSASAATPRPSHHATYHLDGPRGNVIRVSDPAAVPSLAKRPCHKFYLDHNGCPHYADCVFSHGYHFTSSALQALRRRAKMLAPCDAQKETGKCENKGCYRGHRCPAGRRCSQPCHFGDGPGMHPDGKQWHENCCRDNTDIHKNGVVGLSHCWRQP